MQMIDHLRLALAEIHRATGHGWWAINRGAHFSQEEIATASNLYNQLAEAVEGINEVLVNVPVE